MLGVPRAPGDVVLADGVPPTTGCPHTGVAPLDEGDTDHVSGE
jgi:hypothetical protein